MLFFMQGPKRLAGFALVRIMFSLWQRYGHMEDFMLWLLQALTAIYLSRHTPYTRSIISHAAAPPPQPRSHSKQRTLMAAAASASASASSYYY